MRRYLCIYLPMWLENTCVDKSGKQPKENRLADTTAAFAMLCRLARWAIRFTPLVAVDSDLVRAYRSRTLSKIERWYWGLVLDITGTERLHGGDVKLTSRLLQSFSRRGFSARMAIAPTVGGAWALSRFASKPLVITDQRLKEALSGLSPPALRLSAEVLENLKQLGIATLDDVFSLPAKLLPPRFGPQIVTRIEQALGIQEEVLEYIKPKDIFTASRRFDIPLTRHESLRNAILDLFSEVFERLTRARKAASFFHISIQNLDRYGTPHNVSKEVSLYHASSDINHVGAVIQPVIESIHSGEGISEIAISAHATVDKKDEQHSFFSETNGYGPEESVNHLVVRLGPDKVKRAYFNESYIPERSFSYESVLEKPHRSASRPLVMERPSYLFQPPEPAHVIALMPDHPPAQIVWRGKRLQIVEGVGPERINDEWWFKNLDGHAPGAGRDYFRLQDELGRWLWIYRDQASFEWFVQGIWA